MSLSYKSKSEKIAAFIRKLPLELDKSDIENFIKMVRPTIGIKSKACQDAQIPLGKSKIGGQPDLPGDLQWPTFNNKPMIFVAQYNLADVPPESNNGVLPAEGFFYVFISHEHENNDQTFRLFYNSSKNISRTPFPVGLVDQFKLKAAKIDFFEFFTIPDDENYKLEEVEEKLSDSEFGFYDLHEEVTEYIEKITHHTSDNLHQLIGHDRSIQSSVVYDFAAKELNLQFATPEQYKKGWPAIVELSKSFELLLQICCCDQNADLLRVFGDGAYYFGITADDLSNQKYDNIKMIYQCT
jgi:uncharacterized protein YwqG